MNTLISVDEMQEQNLSIQEMKQKGIHLSSKDCWCKPDVEQVEGKK